MLKSFKKKKYIKILKKINSIFSYVSKTKLKLEDN